MPLHADATRDVRRPLLALSIGVAILLLIACVNVGSLLVARAAARARETAVKAALGAGTGRLIRQHVIESLVLGVLGTGLGIWPLGAWPRLLAATPTRSSRLRLASVDAAVVAVCVVTVLVWTVLLAAAPVSEALQRRASQRSLTADGRQASRGGRCASAALTVAQVALSVVLVVGARCCSSEPCSACSTMRSGLRRPVACCRSAWPCPGSRYPNQDAFNAFSRRLQETLAGDHRARAVPRPSATRPTITCPTGAGRTLATEGAEPSTAPQADYRAVAPGADGAAGRAAQRRDGSFTESDDHRGAPVVIVDERLAARTWPGTSAVGRRLGVDPAVVGHPVDVGHRRRRRAARAAPQPVEEVREQVYFPGPADYPQSRRCTSSRPRAIPPRSSVRCDAAVRALDPGAADLRRAAARRLRRRSAGPAPLHRDARRDCSPLAALPLAAVGVYGVIAYSVTERRREFGVRLALGARASHVLALVVGEGATLAGAGLATGLVGATAGAWWLRSQLYGVAPWDPAAIGRHRDGPHGRRARRQCLARTASHPGRTRPMR